MPEGFVYQLWAKNLAKPKKDPAAPPRSSETAPPESVSLGGCRRRFIPDPQVVSVSTPVKRQRGNHDS